MSALEELEDVLRHTPHEGMGPNCILCAGLSALSRLEVEIRTDEAEQVARLVMVRCLNKVTGATLAGVIRSERVLPNGTAKS